MVSHYRGWAGDLSVEPLIKLGDWLDSHPLEFSGIPVQLASLANIDGQGLLRGNQRLHRNNE